MPEKTPLDQVGLKRRREYPAYQGKQSRKFNVKRILLVNLLQGNKLYFLTISHIIE